MSSIVISGNTSGSVTLSAPSVAGSQTFTLPYGSATTTSSAVDITLTNSSNRVQNVSMTAFGKSVILPDATTMATGPNVFMINNTGTYAIYIKLNTGPSLVWLPSGQSIQLSLTDNSTAQGQWSNQNGAMPFGFYPYAYPDGVTNYITTRNYLNRMNGYTNIVDNSACVIQPLTSTTMFMAWIRNTNSSTGGNSVYGVVITNTSGTLSFGTVTQIYNGSTTAATMIAGRMLSSTAGLITVDTSTNSRAIPITISGTTISVGTASATFGASQSVSLANGNTTVFAICAMSATQALVYYTTSTTNMVANTITHNGASAPTIGTASAGTTIANPEFISALTPLTATTAQLIYCTTSATTLSTRIITISGTSAPTLGTAITFNYGVIAGSGAINLNSYSSTETSAAIGDGNTSILALVSFTISGTTITLQNSRLLQALDQNNIMQGYNAFTKSSSTTWITAGGGVWGDFLNKWTYNPSDNIYMNGSLQKTFMTATTGATQITSSYGQSAGIFNAWVGCDNTTNLSPCFGGLGVQMFSGSSTTGLVVGSAGFNLGGGGSAAPAVQVFTIL